MIQSQTKGGYQIREQGGIHFLTFSPPQCFLKWTLRHFSLTAPGNYDIKTVGLSATDELFPSCSTSSSNAVRGLSDLVRIFVGLFDRHLGY